MTVELVVEDASLTDPSLSESSGKSRFSASANARWLNVRSVEIARTDIPGMKPNQSRSRRPHMWTVQLGLKSKT